MSLLRFKQSITVPVLNCPQVAEEDCGSAMANAMEQEPYFVDFLRDAPEPTGKPCVFLKNNIHWIILTKYIGGDYYGKISVTTYNCSQWI